MVVIRITDPSTVDRSTVVELLRQTSLVIIEFSKADYTPALLGDVNRLCEEFGEKIEVRFHDHLKVGFDAAVLKHVPDVRNLVLNCLPTIRNEHHIGELRFLRQLWFGIHKYQNPSFLQMLNLPELTYLGLEGCYKSDFDLAPLVSAVNLKRLFIDRHTKNITRIADIPQLETLSLRSIPNSVGLDFLNRISSLRYLTVAFGSRTSINEVQHEGLEELEIVRVRGLETLGDISRFPKLRKLVIDDQTRIDSVDVSGAPLEDLRFLNCKTLQEISGLETLDRLQHMRVYKTNVDLDRLSELDWPKSMEILALYTGRAKRDAAIRQKLDRRGFSDGLHLGRNAC
jgi:hypothetical protein